MTTIQINDEGIISSVKRFSATVGGLNVSATAEVRGSIPKGGTHTVGNIQDGAVSAVDAGITINVASFSRYGSGVGNSGSISITDFGRVAEIGTAIGEFIEALEANIAQATAISGDDTQKGGVL